MHILKALNALHDTAVETGRQMVGPTETQRCINEFCVQYRLLLSAMQSGRQKERRSTEHPLMCEMDRWIETRVRPLQAAGTSMEEYSQAHGALRWIAANTKATSELLTVWGKFDESQDDDGLVYILRDPLKEDAPVAGGGKIPTIWDSTARAFQSRGIAMPPWDEKTHRKLFLTKSGLPSQRAKVAIDDQGRVRAFFVRELKDKQMNVKAVGCVSSIDKMSVEMLGLAYGILAGANSDNVLADPLHINLEMPRPTLNGLPTMANDVVL